MHNPLKGIKDIVNKNFSIFLIWMLSFLCLLEAFIVDQTVYTFGLILFFYVCYQIKKIISFERAKENK